MVIARPMPRPGRTQSERRRATQEALLNATIASLVEEGYAHTTTRGIAERAGVTPGALQHHFATKAQLVAEAIGHLNAKLTDELVAEAPALSRSARRRAEQLLDRVWEIHQGPLIQAVMELSVAARTDLELREALAEPYRDAAARTAAAIARLIPGAAGRADLLGAVETGLATLRGLALVNFMNGSGQDATWRRTRAHLLTLFLDSSAEGTAR